VVNAALLKDLVPLNSLLPTDRAELARGARLGNYQPGQVVFTRGDAAATTVYLLSGEIDLFDGKASRKIAGGTAAAAHPVAQGARRAATGTMTRAGQVLFVEREKLDLMLTWSQTGGVEVVELDTGDWMSALLASPAFGRIPPGNIGQILASMRPQPFKTGDLLVRQGEPGDAWYVVTEGQCHVVQKGADGRLEELSRLGIGQAFGEEALVSGNPRNATVRALSDGMVMRLAADDFNRLLKAPLLTEVGVDDIPTEAVLVDVRLEQEYRQGRLPGALNLPLGKLRQLAATLDPAACYVVYCDTGRRSASATFLLAERGFDARLLSGGIPADEMPVRG
jgi:CRP-like cAMP-binding protein